MTTPHTHADTSQKRFTGPGSTFKNAQQAYFAQQARAAARDAALAKLWSRV